jgi:hypothetical protein
VQRFRRSRLLGIRQNSGCAYDPWVAGAKKIKQGFDASGGGQKKSSKVLMQW